MDAFIKHYLMTNNADLSEVKLIYTYPLSMSKGKLTQLKNIFADKKGMIGIFNSLDAKQKLSLSYNTSTFLYPP